MLGYQFRRQTEGDEPDKRVAESIGQAVARTASAISSEPRSFIEGFLAVAEFLAREGRTSAAAPGSA